MKLLTFIFWIHPKPTSFNPPKPPSGRPSWSSPLRKSSKVSISSRNWSNDDLIAAASRLVGYTVKQPKTNTLNGAANGWFYNVVKMLQTAAFWSIWITWNETFYHPEISSKSMFSASIVFRFVPILHLFYALSTPSKIQVPKLIHKQHRKEDHCDDLLSRAIGEVEQGTWHLPNAQCFRVGF